MHFKTAKHTVASEIVFAKSAKNSMVWLEWRAQSTRVVSRAKLELRAKPEIKRERERCVEKARCAPLQKSFENSYLK